MVAGRYRFDDATKVGYFRYADSYRDKGLAWSIDPVNLPFRPGEFSQKDRYGGLHDVLRDAGPDGWGQMLIRRLHGLPDGAAPLRYLLHSGNGDRWGALAIGQSTSPNAQALVAPKLSKLPELADELRAISANLPAVHPMLRKQLFATPSMGGARPKATIQDGTQCWIVKPGLPTDATDLELLEHGTQQWGRAAGMRFAQTVHHPIAGARSAVRVLRFDRDGEKRIMAVSAATLLQAQFPAPDTSDAGRASYPRLAEELRRIGAPAEDCFELYDRMVFNAIVGNDDDHPRNHAVIYRHDERRWRLAPAFDVVPSADDTPTRLFMQVSTGRYDITRESLLADHRRFGLLMRSQAESRLAETVARIEAAFADVRTIFNGEQQKLMHARLIKASALLTS